MVGSMENIAGNYYKKYETGNPIARVLVEGFLRTFDRLTELGGEGMAFEVGCGEGYLTRRLLEHGWNVSAIDVDEEIVAHAREQLNANGPSTNIAVGSIYDLAQGSLADRDLTVCCEVLEHLEHPEQGLEALYRSGARHLVLSVPREPMWRAMNMIRLRYWGALGNTPGHLNHWSTAAFIEFVETRFRIEMVEQPLPWTFVKAAR